MSGRETFDPLKVLVVSCFVDPRVYHLWVDASLGRHFQIFLLLLLGFFFVDVLVFLVVRLAVSFFVALVIVRFRSLNSTLSSLLPIK